VTLLGDVIFVALALAGLGAIGWAVRLTYDLEQATAWAEKDDV
jgi:hypothetical protein